MGSLWVTHKEILKECVEILKESVEKKHESKKSYKKSIFYSAVILLLGYPRSSFSPILGSIGPIQMWVGVYKQFKLRTQYVSHLPQPVLLLSLLICPRNLEIKINTEPSPARL